MPPKPPTPPSPEPPAETPALGFARAVAVLALLASLLATANEGAIFQARRDAKLGQSLADADRPLEAIEASDWALKWNPHDSEALYRRAALLKNTGQTETLWRALPALLAVHPNRAQALRLAGEQALNRGRFEQAADWLGEALWINPTPSNQPATFWLLSMRAADGANRDTDALRAAVRTLGMIERENFRDPQVRRDLFLDVAVLFQKQGFPVTANHLREVAGRLPPQP